MRTGMATVLTTRKKSRKAMSRKREKVRKKLASDSSSNSMLDTGKAGGSVIVGRPAPGKTQDGEEPAVERTGVFAANAGNHTP